MYDLNPDPYNLYPRTLQWPVLYGSPLTYGYNNSFSADASGTITAVLRWLDANGNPAPNPPHVVRLMLIADTGWMIGWGPLGSNPPTVATSWVTNPLGFLVQTRREGGQLLRSFSAGKLLIQRDASTGEVRIPVNLSAHVEAVSGFQYGQVTAWASLNVFLDDRRAIIRSALDPTYRREISSTGQPMRVLNQPDAVGTMFGDTVISDFPPWPWHDAAGLLYYTVPEGRWADYHTHIENTHHWYSSLTGQWLERGWNWGSPPPRLDFPVVYRSFHFPAPDSNPPVEHVHLRLQDGLDGAQWTANYYMRFHWPYEDWHEDVSRRKLYPRPYNQHREDWTLLAQFSNGHPTEPVYAPEQSITLTLQDTTTGKIGLEVPAGKSAELFKVNTGIEIGRTVSVQYTLAVRSLQIPPRTIWYLFVAQSKEERFGTCNKWSVHGYEREEEWSAKDVKPLYSTHLEWRPYDLP